MRLLELWHQVTLRWTGAFSATRNGEIWGIGTPGDARNLAVKFNPQVIILIGRVTGVACPYLCLSLPCGLLTRQQTNVEKP